MVFWRAHTFWAVYPMPARLTNARAVDVVTCLIIITRARFITMQSVSIIGTFYKRKKINIYMYMNYDFNQWWYVTLVMTLGNRRNEHWNMQILKSLRLYNGWAHLSFLLSYIVIFSLIHNWPDLFTIKQNTAISKHFTKPKVYTRTTSRTIFSPDMDVAETWCIPLEAFASKKKTNEENSPVFAGKFHFQSTERFQNRFMHVKNVNTRFWIHCNILTLILLEPTVINLCNKYRAWSDWQASSFHLDIPKMLMDNSKNGRWIIPFK